MSTPLAKPQLRGLHASQIKINLVGMMVVSVSAALLYKVFVCDKRKQRYSDFYKYVIILYKLLLSYFFQFHFNTIRTVTYLYDFQVTQLHF